MAANGALPSYAAADLTSGLGQLKVSPDIEKLLREQSTSQSSGQPAVAASPPRPPAASPTAAASSNEASQPSASLPRAGSSTSLAPAAAAAQGQPAGQPAAPPSPERGQGVRTSQPFQSGESESVKESRRTVLSHDEEVPDWDFTSSFNFITFGLFAANKPEPNKFQLAAQKDAYWVVSGSLDGTIRSCTVGFDGQIQENQPVSMQAPVLSVCIVHSGVVACGTPTGVIKVIQPLGEVSSPSLEGHRGAVKSLCKLSAARIISCSPEDRTLRVFGTRVPVCESTIEPPAAQAPRCAAAMPSGQIIAGCEDGNARVYNPGNAESIWMFKGHTGAILAVAGLDEVRAATGGEDGTVRLWRLTQMEAERTLTGHDCPVTAVSAVNLSRLVSGGEDGSLRLWRAGDGACLRVFSGHSGAVTALAVTPDALRVVSASKDRTVRLWRENGPADEAPVVLEGHEGEVTCLAVGMQWESVPPADKFSAKRGCARLC